MWQPAAAIPGCNTDAPGAGAGRRWICYNDDQHSIARRIIVNVKARLLIPAATLLLLVLLAALSYVLTVRLTVRGVISDAVTGVPLSGVFVSAGETSVQSDAQGRYVLGDLSRSPNRAEARRLSARRGRCLANPSLLDRAITLDATLQPVVLDGIVTDADHRQTAGSRDHYCRKR